MSTRYTAVSPTAMASQTWRRYTHYQFAAQSTLLPVLLAELPKLLPNYVLAFAAGPNEPQERLGLMALTGLLPNQNVYVTPQHTWLVPYVPAVLRGHPFKLGALPDQGPLGLFVDANSGLLAGPGEGEAFFDDAGQPSVELKKVMDFLATLNAQNAATQRAVDALKAAEVLEPWPIRLQLPNTAPGAEPGSKATKQLGGLWRVNEKALNALAPEALATLRDQGALAVAYAQMYAMAQLQSLVALVRRLANAPKPASPSTNTSANGLPAAPAFQLPANDTLKFS